MMSFVQKTLVDSDYHEFVNHKTCENDVASVSFDPIGLLSTNHIVMLQGHTKVYKEMFNVNTSNSWHYSCPHSVCCQSTVFLVVV